MFDIVWLTWKLQWSEKKYPTQKHVRKYSNITFNHNKKIFSDFML